MNKQESSTFKVYIRVRPLLEREESKQFQKKRSYKLKIQDFTVNSI